MGVVTVHQKLGVAKYKQIIQSIEKAIRSGELQKGDKLPSINSIRYKFDLSRDTVLLAFRELKNKGVISSVAGKGYYVQRVNLTVTKRIFVLFDELNSFKEDLYNAFVSHLDDDVEVHIFFHHFNFDVFKNLIETNAGAYHYYVIMPARFTNVASILERLPNDAVYILDQMHESLTAYPGVYQNFEKDIYTSLLKTLPYLEKYHTLVLLFPDKKQPLGMLKGFLNFKQQLQLAHEVIERLEHRIPQKGEVYLILDDNDLILLIKKIKDQQLVIGQDIGIISYNDTLLKEVVEGGITTISTDFKKMGARLAYMIGQKEVAKVENPNRLILRNSL